VTGIELLEPFAEIERLFASLLEWCPFGVNAFLHGGEDIRIDSCGLFQHIVLLRVQVGSVEVRLRVVFVQHGALHAVGAVLLFWELRLGGGGPWAEFAAEDVTCGCE